MTDLPRQGRIAAIDYGTVRIGVAITDVSQTIASPLENYQRRNARLDEQFFTRLATTESIVGFVVGLPVHLDGNSSGMSEQTRQFGTWLGSLTGLPIVYHDERFTSAIAEQYTREMGLTRKRKKAVLDKLAAQILLQSFLESNRDNPSQPRDLAD